MEWSETKRGVTLTKTLWSLEHGMAHALALPLLLIGLVSDSQPQSPPSIDNPGSGPYQISVDVDLVVLPATVRDRQGRSVSDLREQDFKVYEDGVLQPIRLFLHEDIPVTVGLVVDHSGSMKSKLADVTTAARTFVHFSNPEDQMFVVNFNETVSLGLPDKIRFTNDSGALGGAIWSAFATGQTALYDATVMALERLQGGRHDKKVLLIISDGGDNASKHKLAEVTAMAERSSAIIYTIGLFDEGDPDQNPRVLNRLAQATGGEAFFPSQLGDVVAICERIARDIRNQYTLGYAPANTVQNGAYRAVRATAQATGHGRLHVRTRAGYFAGLKSKAGENGVPK